MRDGHQAAAGLWESCGPQSEGHAAVPEETRPPGDTGRLRRVVLADTGPVLAPPIRAATALPPDCALATCP